MTSSDIRRHVLLMAEERGTEKTFCPSEVARAIGGTEWRSLMDDVRKAAADLRDQGAILVLQDGRPVHPLQAKGPIRLRKVTRETPSDVS